jgi:hypothetical protein
MTESGGQFDLQRFLKTMADQGGATEPYGSASGPPPVRMSVLYAACAYGSNIHWRSSMWCRVYPASCSCGASHPQGDHPSGGTLLEGMHLSIVLCERVPQSKTQPQALWVLALPNMGC